MNRRFEEKFADSYGACVSSPRSYRRKRSQSTKPESIDLEHEILKNIDDCRRSLVLAEQKVHGVLINIPVLRVVKNLVLRDVRRLLKIGWLKWRRHLHHERQVERRALLMKRNSSLVAEEMIGSCLDTAVSKVALMRADSFASRSGEDKNKVAFKIQRWSRSRSTHRILQLDGGSVNGRISFYRLPSPGPSMYQVTQKNNCHPKEMQRIEEEGDAGHLPRSFWERNPGKKN